MASIGLPVRPGFTITADVCTVFYRQRAQIPRRLKAEVDAALT